MSHQRWGNWAGGRAVGHVLQAMESGALKSEQGRLWKEGGKSDMSAGVVKGLAE